MHPRSSADRGTRRLASRLCPESGERGLTLVELIVAFSLMLILSAMAVPVASVRVQREKERRLRDALREIRQAIDRHKDMADQGMLAELDPNDHGYPESLEALVEGVELEEAESGLSTSMESGALRQSGMRLSDGQSAIGSGARSGSGSRFGSQGDFGSGRRSLGDAFPERGGLAGEYGSLGEESEKPKAVRFLRSIPVDPMTGRREWGLLSVSDDPQARSWNGRNVFDVYSLSFGLSLDGTNYSDW